MSNLDSITSEALAELFGQGAGKSKDAPTETNFGIFLKDYVVEGATVQLNTPKARQILIDDGVIVLEGTLFAVPGRAVELRGHSAVFFIDFTSKNGYVVSTVHPAEAYTPLWQVTTNQAGTITGATDMRGEVGGVRFKDEIQGIVTDQLVVDAEHILDDAVSTFKLQDRAVTSSKIAIGGVTEDNIGDDEVSHDKIKGQIGEEKLQLDYRSAELAQRLKQLEVQPGNQYSEIVAARAGYPTLMDRLAAIDPGLQVRKAFGTATAGQTVFDISSFGSYAVGQNRIIAFEIGLASQEGAYTESSSTTLTIPDPCNGGEKWTVKFLQGNISILAGHGAAHRAGGGDELNIAELAGGWNEATSISNMKTLRTIHSGDYIRTQGYYSAGDLGGAEYLAVSYQGRAGDDVTLIDLPNGLQAKLAHNGSIRAEQIGLKKNTSFNNTPRIVSAIAGGVKDFYFALGTYQFDELLITYNTAQSITGTFNLGSNIRFYGACPLGFGFTQNYGTIFAPYRTSQRFIVKFGGTIDFAQQTDALATDVSNSGCIDIGFMDAGKPTTKGCLSLEYTYGCNFRVGFYAVEGRSLYIKNCWELNFPQFTMRVSKFKGECIYIDTIISDGLSNTTRLYFPDVDVEGISGPFLKTSVGDNAANILIGDFTYEHTFANAYTVQPAAPNTEAQFRALTKIPLFDLGFIDGLSIDSMNLHGLSKKWFTDGTTNYTDSVFRFSSFFHVSVGQININDSGGYVQLTDGVGEAFSLLKVGVISSTKHNRLFPDGTVPAGQLLMLNLVTTGTVEITDNSFKVNGDMPLTSHGLYIGEKLLKINPSLKSGYTMAYDALATTSYAISRLDATSFQSFTSLLFSNHLRVRVRLRSDVSIIQIQTRAADGSTIVGQQNYPLTGNASAYQEVDVFVRKDPTAVSWRVILPTTGTVCFLDYVNVQPLAVSETLQASLTNNTAILTAGLTSVRVSPTSNVTGIILNQGFIGGQEITVFNESAFTITFATTGSLVADANLDVIAAGTARRFTWNAGTSLWYRLQ